MSSIWATSRPNTCIPPASSCNACCTCPHREPSMADVEFQPLDRDGIAARIARDIPEGWFVNLGIGIPTKVSDFVHDREVIFHAENGVIGIGPAPAEDAINPYLVNAGVQHITLITGAALVHHADSFAIA